MHQELWHTIGTQAAKRGELLNSAAFAFAVPDATSMVGPVGLEPTTNRL